MALAYLQASHICWWKLPFVPKAMHLAFCCSLCLLQGTCFLCSVSRRRWLCVPHLPPLLLVTSPSECKSSREALSVMSQARAQWDLVFRGQEHLAPIATGACPTVESQLHFSGPTCPRKPLITWPCLSPQQPAADLPVSAALHGHPPAVALLHDHFRHPW